MQRAAPFKVLLAVTTAVSASATARASGGRSPPEEAMIRDVAYDSWVSPRLAGHLCSVLRASPADCKALEDFQQTYHTALTEATIREADGLRIQLEAVENILEPALVDEVLFQSLDDVGMARVEGMRARRKGGEWLFPGTAEFRDANRRGSGKLMAVLWKREGELRREFVDQVAVRLGIVDPLLRSQIANRVISFAIAETPLARSQHGTTVTPTVPYDFYGVLMKFLESEECLKGIVEEVFCLIPAESAANPFVTPLRTAVLQTDSEVAPLLEAWLLARPRWSHATSQDEAGTLESKRNWAASEEATQQVTRARWTGAVRIRDAMAAIEPSLANRWMDWYVKDSSREAIASDQSEARLASLAKLIAKVDPRWQRIEAASTSYFDSRRKLRLLAGEALANEATLSGGLRNPKGAAASRLAELDSLRRAFEEDLASMLTEEEAAIWRTQHGEGRR